MYTPPAFRVSGHGRLHDLIRDYPFAALVSTGKDGLQITHLPFMLDPPWTTARAEPDIDRQLDHIIVFEIEIVRLEGKFKLSQNRSRADRQGVAQALAEADDPLRRSTAEAMQTTLADGKERA